MGLAEQQDTLETAYTCTQLHHLPWLLVHVDCFREYAEHSSMAVVMPAAASLGACKGCACACMHNSSAHPDVPLAAGVANGQVRLLQTAAHLANTTFACCRFMQTHTYPLS
jgi:hypothetical protein